MPLSDAHLVPRRLKIDIMQLPDQGRLLEVLGDPQLLDDDVPWAYNTLTWQVERGDDHLELKLEPGYQRIALLWSTLGKTLVSFDVGALSDLRIQHDPKSVALVFKTRSIQLRVQLAPGIQILVIDEVA
jgi:hypothetical protein